jgi:hypothetical protein
MGEKRNPYKVLLGKSGGKNYYEDLNIGRRIILKWLLEKYDAVLWTAFMRLSIGTRSELL